MKSSFMGDFENYGLSIPKHKYLITSLSNQAQKNSSGQTKTMRKGNNLGRKNNTMT